MDSDAETIQRLQEKDDRAWDQLVEHHYQGLVLFCGRYVEDLSDAQDLVQITLTKAMDKIASFDLKRFDAIKPWLWQIAKYTAIDHLRSRKNKEDKWQSIRPSNSFTTQTYLRLVDFSPGPRTKAQKIDKNKLLFETIDKLNEKFSEILVLHYVDGLTRKQIAAFLEISENTVKSRLRIAMQRLRNLLPKELYEKS